MPHLSLSLFGGFQAKYDDRPLNSFRSVYVQCLLAYLAFEQDQAQPRERLAALFWPNEPDATARHNLSQSLYLLRSTLKDSQDAPLPFLLADRQTIQFNPQADTSLDTRSFEELLTAGRVEEAVGLYRGPLLADVFIESVLFEEWLVQARETLHRQMMAAISSLTESARGQADWPAVQRFARRQLILEPWREDAHRQLMMAMLAMGDRSAAIAQFEICRRTLQEELGALPAPQTMAFYEQIRSGEGIDVAMSAVMSTVTPAPELHSRAEPLQDWGSAPYGVALFDRDHELSRLRGWILGDGCRVVGILGMGGVGKTALSVRLAQELIDQFDVVIWRSLLNAPPLDEILRGWLQLLEGRPLHDLPPSLNERLDLLFAQLSRRRCLLILDNAESILSRGEQAGGYLPGYEGYDLLLRGVATRDHGSCLLLTSRERPQELERLERDLPWVRWLELTGLPEDGGHLLLHDLGLDVSPAQGAELLRRYSGNPLALKLAVETIQDLFLGDVDAFLSEETPIFDDIQKVLQEQFERLSDLEQEVLIWLAVNREPVLLATLEDDLLGPVRRGPLLSALRSLQRRSLVERSHNEFTLQNVVMEFVTERFITHLAEEIKTAQPQLLHRHPVLKAHADESVRRSQDRLIVDPLCAQLLARLGRLRLAQQLKALLAQLQMDAPLLPSYAAGTLLNLLIHLGEDLTGLDTSNLSIWQADLAHAMLPDVDFRNTHFRHSRFTQLFSAVKALAFHPSGQTLAAATEDGSVHTWQLDDSRPADLVLGHSSYAAGVAYSPNGRLLASGGGDQLVRVWDTVSNEVYCTLAGHSGLVWAVAFSPNGQILASGGADQTIRLWSDAGRGEVRILRGHSAAVRCLAFSPNGRLLVSGGEDNTVRFWDVATGTLLDTCTEHTQLVCALAFSPNGGMLASGSYDRTVCVWEVTGRRPVQRLTSPQNAVSSLSFSVDGRWLAVGSYDHCVRVWETGAWTEQHILHAHTNWVRAVRFSPDGKTLVSGGHDQTIRFWQLPSGRLQRTIQGHSNWVRAVRFSPDGNWLATGSNDHLVRVWDWQAGEVHRTLRGQSGLVYAVDFSPDGRLVAGVGHDYEVLLWNVDAGRLQRALAGHENNVMAVAFSPDGSLLASSSNDQTVRIWETGSGRTLHVLRGHDNWVRSVRFSPCGRFLATGGGDEIVRIWDVESGRCLRVLKGHSGWIGVVVYSPDGRLLASSGEDATVRLWDTASGEPVQVLRGHEGWVRALDFAPDGVRLASGGDDQQVLVWDGVRGEVLRRYRGSANAVLSVAFHPDGEWLATSGTNENICLWQTTQDRELRMLRAPGPYAGMQIEGVTGLTDAQRDVLRRLGAGLAVES